MATLLIGASVAGGAKTISAGRKISFEGNDRVKLDGLNGPKVVSRPGALNAAKRDLGIPRSQHPDAVNRVPMTRNGEKILGSDHKPIMTREYTYTRPDGSKVVIQDHSAGHEFGQGGVGDQGPHLNVRPPENTRNGTVPGTEEHYYFE
ncbi:HNH/endonuclease VII fold putative polymorphic toxin [Pseudomonas sp. ZS1P83]